MHCWSVAVLCDVTHLGLIIRLARDPATASIVACLRLMFSSLGAALLGGAAAMRVRVGREASSAPLTLAIAFRDEPPVYFRAIVASRPLRNIGFLEPLGTGIHGAGRAGG